MVPLSGGGDDDGQVAPVLVMTGDGQVVLVVVMMDIRWCHHPVVMMMDIKWCHHPVAVMIDIGWNHYVCSWPTNLTPFGESHRRLPSYAKYYG